MLCFWSRGRLCSARAPLLLPYHPPTAHAHARVRTPDRRGVAAVRRCSSWLQRQRALPPVPPARALRASRRACAGRLVVARRNLAPLGGHRSEAPNRTPAGGLDPRGAAGRGARRGMAQRGGGGRAAGVRRGGVRRRRRAARGAARGARACSRRGREFSSNKTRRRNSRRTSAGGRATSVQARRVRVLHCKKRRARRCVAAARRRRAARAGLRTPASTRLAAAGCTAACLSPLRCLAAPRPTPADAADAARRAPRRSGGAPERRWSAVAAAAARGIRGRACVRRGIARRRRGPTRLVRSARPSTPSLRAAARRRRTHAGLAARARSCGWRRARAAVACRSAQRRTAHDHEKRAAPCHAGHSCGARAAFRPGPARHAARAPPPRRVHRVNSTPADAAPPPPPHTQPFSRRALPNKGRWSEQTHPAPKVPPRFARAA
jgi:hypothetical protein